LKNLSNQYFVKFYAASADNPNISFTISLFNCVLGINPDPQVIEKLFKELILFTAKTA
jgi:hypothetical protein